MKRHQQGFTAIELMIVVGGVVSVGGLIATVWVLCHFLSKFW